MSAMMDTGNPVLDAYVADAAPEIAFANRQHFVGKNAEQRLDLAREGIAVFMLRAEELARQLGSPIACGDRCSACCIYIKGITVLPVEIGRILDLVERQGHLEEVKRRAEMRRARGNKGACPLLSQDGRCTVYGERPLSCRRYHSADRAACESSADPIVPWIPPMVAAGLALTALAQWTDEAGVDLFEALPVAAGARVKRARKRRQRARAPA